MENAGLANGGQGMRILKMLAMLGGLAVVAGCATITTGSTDLVTIDTDPPGAVCKLTRGDKQIGVINPTPDSLEVPKSQHDLTVRCEREGYLVTEGTIESGFQAMTLGNVLFGGVVGVIIDAASGAMTKYEDGAKITLIPEAFPTIAERDAFFDQVIADLQGRYDVAVAEIERGCADEAACESKLKKATKKLDARLAELEVQRGLVTITGEAAPEGDGSTETTG
jgi:hypothetical protein